MQQSIGSWFGRRTRCHFYGRNILIAVALVGFSFIMRRYKGLPNVLIVMFALIALFVFITTRTTFGRRIYAMGGNEKAAKLSGVNTERLTFMIFTIIGVMNNGMSIMGIGIDWQFVIKGAVLMFAVFLDVYYKTKG